MKPATGIEFVGNLIRAEMAVVEDRCLYVDYVSVYTARVLVQSLIEILNGTEWNSNTLDEMAHAFIDAGVELRSPDSFDEKRDT